MRAATQQAAWDLVGAQALTVVAAWERMVANDPELKVPLHFADAMRELAAAAEDHQEWMRAAENGPVAH